MHHSYPRNVLFGACVVVAIALPAQANATTVRVATWNLGWHVSQAELGSWITQCAKSYAKDSASGIWEVVPAQTSGAQIGWEIGESRPQLQGVDLAVMPPCGVYRSPSGIAVTPAAWAKRNEQIAKLLSDVVKPDVIAFQEVSGAAAGRRSGRRPATTRSVPTSPATRSSGWHSLGRSRLGPRSVPARTFGISHCRSLRRRTRSARASPSP